MTNVTVFDMVLTRKLMMENEKKEEISKSKNTVIMKMENHHPSSSSSSVHDDNDLNYYSDSDSEGDDGGSSIDLNTTSSPILQYQYQPHLHKSHNIVIASDEDFEKLNRVKMKKMKKNRNQQQQQQSLMKQPIKWKRRVLPCVIALLWIVLLLYHWYDHRVTSGSPSLKTKAEELREAARNSAFIPPFIGEGVANHLAQHSGWEEDLTVGEWYDKSHLERINNHRIHYEHEAGAMFEERY